MDNRSAELLLACAQDDRRALKQLYDLWAGRLLGVALRITRDRSLAEDALQDSFVQIWKQAQLFDPARGRAEAWLHTLARRKAIDVVRRRPREVLGVEIGERVGTDPSPLDHLLESRDGVSLRRCLDTLDESRRRLILLSFVEGRSHQELSAMLALPLGTVKSTIRRSLVQLRQCLEA